MFEHWSKCVPSAGSHYTTIVLLTAKLSIPYVKYPHEPLIHLCCIMPYIWDQLFVAFKACSGWNLRLCMLPRVHDVRLLVLCLCCSTMPLCPNRSRCYWVHINMYPGKEPMNLREALWMAMLTERQLWNSESTHVFYHRGHVQTLLQHYSPLQCRNRRQPLGFSYRIEWSICWTWAHSWRGLSGGSNKLHISTHTVPPALTVHCRRHCRVPAKLWAVLILASLY